MKRKQEIYDWVEAHPAVNKWLARYRPTSAANYRRYAYRYFTWVEEHRGEFAGRSPEELLDLQEQAVGRDRYRQLDMLQEYVNDLEGRHNSKRSFYSAIRSFYARNRVPLPQDSDFQPINTRDPVVSELDLDKFREMLVKANTRYRAIFLIMYQSAMGVREFSIFNMQWEKVKPQLDDEVVKIDLPGRKRGRGVRRYYTFITRDAIDALKEYLDERGEAKPGEAIFLNDRGAPVTAKSIRWNFLQSAIKVGLVERATPPCPECGGETQRKRTHKRVGGKKTSKYWFRCRECGHMMPAGQAREDLKGHRYGFNPHEMRDLLRSEWTKARGIPDVVEFIMGHQIDPNQYNKFFRDVDYVRDEYLALSNTLNVWSNKPTVLTQRRRDKEVESLRQRVNELETQLDRWITIFGDIPPEKLLEDIDKTRWRWLELEEEIRKVEWLFRDPEVAQILRDLVEERREKG